MLRDKLCHLEHADRCPAAEDLFQGFIGIDIPLVDLVLKAVLLDIDPQFFDHFRPGHWARADYYGEVRADVHRPHECCVGFAWHMI